MQTHGSGLAGAVRHVLGSRAEVAEVVQDALAKACEALSRGVRPRDPAGWLFVVALNTARDHRRRRRRENNRQSLEDVPAMDLATLQTSPGVRLERAEALAAARAAISRLAEREKEVFLLRTSAGLSYEAASRALGLPVGTAKTRMRSALLSLRAALAAHAPERETAGRDETQRSRRDATRP